MKITVVELVAPIVLVVLVGCLMVETAPATDGSEVILSRVVRQTTYKYSDSIAAYTYSPFAPKTTPTTTTTTTPAPITTKKPWWKLWR